MVYVQNTKSKVQSNRFLRMSTKLLIIHWKMMSMTHTGQRFEGSSSLFPGKENAKWILMNVQRVQTTLSYSRCSVSWSIPPSQEDGACGTHSGAPRGSLLPSVSRVISLWSWHKHLSTSLCGPHNNPARYLDIPFFQMWKWKLRVMRPLPKVAGVPSYGTGLFLTLLERNKCPVG